jgi:hypothetical protein
MASYICISATARLPEEQILWDTADRVYRRSHLVEQWIVAVLGGHWCKRWRGMVQVLIPVVFRSLHRPVIVILNCFKKLAPGSKANYFSPSNNIVLVWFFLSLLLLLLSEACPDHNLCRGSELITGRCRLRNTTGLFVMESMCWLQFTLSVMVTPRYLADVTAASNCPQMEYSVTNNRSSITAMIQRLGWRSLEDRRRDARLTILYKINHELVAISKTNLIFLSEIKKN